MTKFRRSTAIRTALLAATALLALPATAQAQDAGTQSNSDRPSGSEEVSGIVPSTGINPNASPPAGILDNAVNITGVGQMRTITNLTTRAGFVCSGTLINPRTVITAAHCVNGQAANTYGFNTGGTPISFGFQADKLNRGACGRDFLRLASSFRWMRTPTRPMWATRSTAVSMSGTIHVRCCPRTPVSSIPISRW